MPQLFQDRKGFMVYYEADELEELRQYARANCLMLSQWIRRITLHVLTKQRERNPPPGGL